MARTGADFRINTDDLWKAATFTLDIGVRRGWRTRVGLALFRLAAFVLRAGLVIRRGEPEACISPWLP